MTDPTAPAVAALAEAIRDLPGGLAARPVTPADLPALTDLLRASDVAGCGHTSTNVDEIRDELDDPDCGWARGCTTVWRGPDLVGALIVFDGLASDRGWMMDVYCAPGDPQAHEIQGALIDSALAAGRARWSALLGGPAGTARDLPAPVAKSGCHANDTLTRADLEARGFVEVRRFWRMRIEHDSRAPVGTQPTAVVVPDGYTIRPFDGSDDDLRALHRTFSAAFLDHFDFTPIAFDRWLEHNRGATDDTTQWLIAEHADVMVGFARGSNRYASEGSGYVASIGVVRGHRGRGLARALLRARIADDLDRGRQSTLLHVDATNPTGATRVYESVGMTTDSETVWFHRPLLDAPDSLA